MTSLKDELLNIFKTDHSTLVYKTGTKFLLDIPPNKNYKTDCGNKMWTIIHRMALRIALTAFEEESDQLQLNRTMKSFIEFVTMGLTLFHPCLVCSKNWKLFNEESANYIDPHEGDPLAILIWTFEAHNKVNARLGKPVFTSGQFCTLIDETLYSIQLSVDDFDTYFHVPRALL